MPRTKQFNEEEVLKKAMDLFWRKGYNATSIQDLVEHLGINRASLYDTFGGKQSLFKKSFSHYREGHMKNVNAMLSGASTVQQGFHTLFSAMIRESLQDADSKGCFVVNSTTELLPENTSCQALILQNKREMETLFEQYLQAGINKGEIDASKDASAIAAYLFLFINGLRVITKVETDARKLNILMDQTLQILG